MTQTNFCNDKARCLIALAATKISSKESNMTKIDAVGRKEQDLTLMIKQFDEAKAWLESIGIDISSGRFQQYKKRIERSLENGKFFSPDFCDSDTLWAIAELHDLLELFDYLKSFDDEKVKKTLSWLKKGPALLEDEPKDGGKIHGRNFTFELYAACRFLRSGLPVSYESDADINLSVLDTLLHVECKRAVTENNLDGLIEKAIDQIDGACLNNQNDRGLIVLSLSKIFWKVQIELNQGHAAEESELQRLLEPVSRNIAEAIRSTYAQKSENVIGLIFHYKVPFYRKKNGFPAFINRFSFISFSEPGTKNKLISDTISQHLKSSMYRSG